MKVLGIVVLVSLAMPMGWLGHAAEAHRARPQLQSPVADHWPKPSISQQDSAQKVTYRLDFSDYAGGPVEAWLERKGFKLEEDAKDRKALALSVQNGSLVLEAKGQIRGFLYNDSLNIEKYSKVRIVWGILKYPEGASYERQVRNEALMIYVSFGREKVPSGKLVLPDLPYFIGLFLCQGDKLHTPYVGKYYQESGRFVCLGHAEPIARQVSEFDLASAFRAYFEKPDVPPISGVNIGIDTSEAGDGGRAAAYLRAIEFIE